MESIEKHETCDPLNMIIEPLTRDTKIKTIINKTNDLILNLTPENVTQHSKID